MQLICSNDDRILLHIMNEFKNYQIRDQVNITRLIYLYSKSLFHGYRYTERTSTSVSFISSFKNECVRRLLFCFCLQVARLLFSFRITGLPFRIKLRRVVFDFQCFCKSTDFCAYIWLQCLVFY